jgi:Anti-sigma-K factor rskA/Sigma-70 region 2
MIDATVIEAFRAGEPEAVRAVYRSYGPSVFAVAHRMLGDRGLAEEATQQTFVQAWKAAARFDADPEERHALDGIRDLLADPTLWEDPSADLEDDVVAAITAQSQVATLEADRDRSNLLRRRVLAVAAVVLVVLAAGTVALRPWQSNGPSAQHFAMTLHATPLAPDARGNASLTKTASGWRIVLHATGLTRLDNGRYYQAWLKNAAGTLVPVGTFNDARNVTLWSGVSPVDYSTLTITIEAADGNQASSGRRVVVGTITR